MRRYHAPLDPDCPSVAAFMDALFSDPMTMAINAPTDDIVDGFARRHRSTCQRCKECGAANIEIEN